MRLVFFGSGDFGLPTLERLRAEHDIVAVVSQPDRPAGRGGRSRPTPVADAAAKWGIRVLGPDTPNTPEFADTVRQLGADVAVVVAYGHLLGRELLTTTPLGFVNLHASLLPAYRGAAPVPWAILNGETVSGASVFILDERFDTGAVIARVEVPIDPDDTSGDYLAKLAPYGGDLMSRAVADLAAGVAAPQAQDESKASKAPKLKKEDGRLDWSQPFDSLERRVRAFQPWPHAFTMMATAKGDVRINVLKMERADADHTPATPGTILAADAKHGLVVMTGDGPARLARLQPEGKRAMSDTEYLRGATIRT